MVLFKNSLNMIILNGLNKMVGREGFEPIDLDLIRILLLTGLSYLPTMLDLVRTLINGASCEYT